MTAIRLVNFNKFDDAQGTICVYECGVQIPFFIKRVFTISALPGSIRGNHAHLSCTQLLICISGKIIVRCDDGNVVNEFILSDPGVGLMISPRVWASQEYVGGNSMLMVLCDHLYEEKDYVRDHEIFKKLNL